MITVASVPTAHRYVTHLDAADPSPTILRLPDPSPTDLRPGEQRWWPPRWLEPEWLRRNVDRFDLLHLHFGFDNVPVATLTDVVDVLRRHGKPLVFTVHDLHNPHFVDNTLHDAHLDVLVPAADVVITLTTGAAAEIERRWGVPATVVPHPHVAPLELVGRSRNAHEQFVIGVHAKNLRANLNPMALLDVVIATAADLSATVRIDIDDDVMARADGSADALRDYSAHPGVDVRAHPRFDDAELWEYLCHVDVSLLPYRFGTHSGWLEACYDVGTAVIAPDCGYYGDQKPCHTFGFGVDRLDSASLDAAIRQTREDWSTDAVPRASRRERESERAEIALAHESIYARALDAVTAGSTR